MDAMATAAKDQPRKQRHTAKRIFERRRDEHGFMGKVTIVKDYVTGWRQRVCATALEGTADIATSLAFMFRPTCRISMP